MFRPLRTVLSRRIPLLLGAIAVLCATGAATARAQALTRAELVNTACAGDNLCRQHGSRAVRDGLAVQRVMAAACSAVRDAGRGDCYARAFAAVAELSEADLMTDQEPLLGEPPFGMNARALREFFAENAERCAGHSYRCYQGKLQFLDLRITFGRYGAPYAPRDEE